MRVLYLTYEDVILHGVLQNMVVNVLNRVGIEHGVFADIVSFRRPDENPEMYLRNKKRKLSTNIRIIEHLKLGKGKSRGILSIINLLPHYITYAFRLRKYDVLHVRSYAFIPLLVVGKLLGKVCIWDPRGILSLELKDIDNKESFSTRILVYIEKIGAKSSDKIICVSQAMKYYLENIYSCHCLVIPNPTSFNEFKKGIDEKNGAVYIGRMLSWHMPEMISEFVKACQELHIPVTIITPDVKIAKDLLRKDVNIISLSAEEIRQYLPKYRFAYCVIRPTESKRYCAPVKFAEYLGSKLLVIANRDIGDIESYINQTGNGIILKEFSKEGFKVALNELDTKNFVDTEHESKYDLSNYSLVYKRLYYGEI